MTATYCVPTRWYYIKGATLLATQDGVVKPRLWDGWIWVTEKKYHSDRTVTLFGFEREPPDRVPDRVPRTVVLEMRRGLTVKTLKDGPPAYVIQEETLV